MFEVKTERKDTTIGFRVDATEKTVLERIAQERNMRPSDVVRIAVRDYIEREAREVQCHEYSQ